MAEIHLKLEEKHLDTLLGLLRNLQYVEVSLVRSKTQTAKKSKSNSLLSDAIRAPRQDISLDQLIAESGYRGTDWDEISRLSKQLDIQESFEELTAQIRP